MSTYLGIVNRALREVNEVPLTEATFVSNRGLQQFVKEAANRAYFDIANESVEWPWLHNTVSRVEGTEVLTLVAGEQWYDKGALELETDWHTFYITDKNPEVESLDPPEISRNLSYCTYEQWARTDREHDNQRTVETRGVPSRVIRHPNGKIGFSPVPDKPYYIEYFVWKTAESMVNATDVIPFPEEFDNVLLNKIRYYIWLFRENETQAQMAKSDYEKSLTNMKRILLSNKSERMRAR